MHTTHSYGLPLSQDPDGVDVTNLCHILPWGEEKKLRGHQCCSGDKIYTLIVIAKYAVVTRPTPTPIIVELMVVKSTISTHAVLD